MKICGNEGHHPYLSETGKLTLRFLRAAIDFIPTALKISGDLSNASFLFAHPGNELVIKAGDGEWEFYFSQRADGTIHGRCVHMPDRIYILNVCKWFFFKYFGIPMAPAITDS